MYSIYFPHTVLLKTFPTGELFPPHYIAFQTPYNLNTGFPLFQNQNYKYIIDLEFPDMFLQNRRSQKMYINLQIQLHTHLLLMQRPFGIILQNTFYSITYIQTVSYENKLHKDPHKSFWDKALTYWINYF